ncbi:MAG: methyltransferase domain-containing protein [Acidobacteria bacterium]|nr:methyltransferase domain-containing protein [Acidobacteriota bacterium]
MFSRSARGRLTDKDLGRFPDDTLFHAVARAVCHAGCLPRKELYEAWEMARRVRRRLRGGRVLDLGAGHGLLAQLLLLLDQSSRDAVVVDPAPPAPGQRVHSALVSAWPWLAGRVDFVTGRLEEAGISATDLVVSCHACGALTDLVLQRAAAARSRVAVLPCCHDLGLGDTGQLGGWVDGSLAIDIQRATRLAQQGYRIWTHTLPAEITVKNRLLMGAPMPLGEALRRGAPAQDPGSGA